MTLLAPAAAAAHRAAPAAAPEDEVVLERYEYRRLVMGTQARLVIYAGDEEAARAAASEAFDELDRLDRMLSDWLADSELSELSLHAGGPPVPASPELVEVLGLGLAVAEVTGGAFDPTLGALTKLWRTCREEERLPTAAELTRARARSGFEHLAVDTAEGTVRLARPEMELDLGGIAKGYACDRALAMLAERGLERALVEIGGDFAVGAAPPDREGWRLALECRAPEQPEELVVAHRGVATSGDSAQHLDVDGVRYSHVLDPATGLGTVEGWCVTVVAPSGALADALACAASVPGRPEVTRALAQFDARVAAAMRAGAAPAPDAGTDTVQEGTDGPRRPGQTGPAPEQGELGAWVPLFDGATLDGWTTSGGRYDGDAVWTVEDACLVGRTGPDDAGGLIYTERMYSAFELALDVWIDYPFDSGVFTNMLPRESGLKGLQVTLDYRGEGEGRGEVGGIYADGWLHHQPDGFDQWKRGEWNRVVVRQTGFDPRVRFWLNDELVTDYTLPADANGYAPHGRIGLQVHGGGSEGEGNAVRFRGLRLRELPVLEGLEGARREGTAGVLELSADARRAGWTDLLAGDSLDAFDQAESGVYALEDGVLSMPADADGGVLATKADFRDLRMRLDFTVPTMGNSGVYLRSARDGANPSFSGAEVQILDDFNWERVTGSTLKPWQFTGSLYGAVPAGDHGRLRPLGQWNTYEFLIRGDRYATALNGLVLWDVRTSALEPEQGAPFSERADAGFVGVQTHGPAQASENERLAFRNWFVQPLDG